MKTNWQTKSILWASALLLLVSVDAAHAGAWVVDGYEYTEKTHGENQSFNQGGALAPDLVFPGWYREILTQNNSSFHKPSGPHYGYGTGGDIRLFKDTYSVPGPYEYIPGKASASLTITPIFRWEANRIYNDDNTQGIADPNDGPPKKLWYYESGKAHVGRTAHRTGVNYTEQLLYTGHHFSISNIENGLGSGTRQFHSPANTIIDEAFKEQVIEKDSGGQTTVRGETRTLSVEVIPTAAGLYSTRHEEAFTAFAGVHYEVDTIGFDVFSRIKADHDPTDLYSDLRPSGYYPGSSASIAAGGFATENNEHEADIVMRIKRQSGNFGYGSPLPGVRRSTLPRIHINNREGVNKAAQSHALNTGTTDSDGRVMAEHLISRDLESHGGPGGEVSVGLGSVPYVNNRIGMGWGQTEWRMGQNGEKQWNTRFLLLGGDYSEWAWCKVKNYDDKPLLNHTMKLIVDRLQVRAKDAQTGDVQTTLYTTNLQEAIQYSGNNDPSFRVVYAEDLTGDVSRFITLPGEMSDSGGGVYKGQFTVKKVEGFEFEKLNFSLEDQGVYRITG